MFARAMAALAVMPFTASATTVLVDDDRHGRVPRCQLKARRDRCLHEIADPARSALRPSSRAGQGPVLPLEHRPRLPHARLSRQREGADPASLLRV